jgi:hypothetical protein
MPSIKNPELTVTTNRPVDRAAVLVSCDLEFTDVEVNAMNLLGLQYTLSCEVINKDLLDEDPVVTYHNLTFPRVANDARRYEHVIFDSYEAMELLHDRLIGKDKLRAKLTLRNEETHEEVTARTEVIAVDLAA